MSILFILLTSIFLAGYVCSILALCDVFVDNDISVNLWSLFLLLLPIVNTILAIKYKKKIFFNFFSIKKFLKEIKNLK